MTLMPIHLTQGDAEQFVAHKSRNEKIQAVRFIKDRLGIDLKPAKAHVDHVWSWSAPDIMRFLTGDDTTNDEDTVLAVLKEQNELLRDLIDMLGERFDND